MDEEKIKNLKQYLAGVTHSENMYRHRLVPGVVYSDGVKHVAEETEAFWLIDEIATFQLDPKIRKNKRLQQLQIWELSSMLKGAGFLTCSEDKEDVKTGQPPPMYPKGRKVISKCIETAFPLDIKFYVVPIFIDSTTKRCILLPAER